MKILNAARLSFRITLAFVLIFICETGSAQNGNHYSTCDSALIVSPANSSQWLQAEFQQGSSGQFFWIKFQATSSQIVFEVDTTISNTAQIQNTTLNGGGVLPKP